MAIAPPAEPHLRDVSSARIITRGYFRMLNFFDIAEAIDLEKLRILLGPHTAPRSPGFVHLTPEYAQAQNPPLEESIEPLPLPSGEKLSGKIKYYWFGVASVELTTPFRCDLSALCADSRSEEHTSELQSHSDLVCRLLLEKKKSIEWI